MSEIVRGIAITWRDRCEVEPHFEPPHFEIPRFEAFRPYAFVEPLSASLRLAHRPREQGALASTSNRSLRIWQTDHGLHFEADVSAPGVIRAIRSGGLNSCSISFRAIEEHQGFIDEEEDFDVGCALTTVHRARLTEVSLLGGGAYPQTAAWVAGDEHLLPPMMARMAAAWATPSYEHKPARIVHQVEAFERARRADDPEPEPPRGRRSGGHWARVWAGAYFRSIGGDPDVLRARVRQHMANYLMGPR